MQYLFTSLNFSIDLVALHLLQYLLSILLYTIKGNLSLELNYKLYN